MKKSTKRGKLKTADELICEHLNEAAVRLHELVDLFAIQGRPTLVGIAASARILVDAIKDCLAKSPNCDKR